MNFDGIEVVAPLIRVVRVDTVAGDRMGQNDDVIAFSIQRQGNGGRAGARWTGYLLNLTQAIKIIFNGAAFFWREFARRRL